MVAKIEIPSTLIEAVKNTRVIPFLGAGASKEAKDMEGNRPPDADLLFRQVWYNRHLNYMYQIESGEIEVVDEVGKTDKGYYRQDQISRGTLETALAAGDRTRKEVGVENLGPWTDFEWGMLNGKLSALRWVTGSEWDFLDT